MDYLSSSRFKMESHKLLCLKVNHTFLLLYSKTEKKILFKTNRKRRPKDKNEHLLLRSRPRFHFAFRTENKCGERDRAFGTVIIWRSSSPSRGCDCATVEYELPRFRVTLECHADFREATLQCAGSSLSDLPSWWRLVTRNPARKKTKQNKKRMAALCAVRWGVLFVWQPRCRLHYVPLDDVRCDELNDPSSAFAMDSMPEEWKGPGWIRIFTGKWILIFFLTD